MIQIKSWRDGSVLYTAQNATDIRAALEEAVLNCARLNYAQLNYARLSGAQLNYAQLNCARLNYAQLNYAQLSGAQLNGAQLNGARLNYAQLNGAQLSGAQLNYAQLNGAQFNYAQLNGAQFNYAQGLQPERVNPLLILGDQVGPIRAYKLVSQDGMSPIQRSGRIQYALGETVEVHDANTDPQVQCGAGVNLATLPWCTNQWRPGYRILVAEFTADDIAAIPVGDGKFRVRKAKIVGEKDLVALGLVKD